MVGDLDAFMAERDRLVSYRLTASHLKFFFTNFLPETTIHSKAQDTRIVRSHYDRGNDFFEYFLGDSMVYTAGFFEDANETLEQGQARKVDLICKKLKLEKNEKMLDIGCGWSTLIGSAARDYGVDSTGVTLSKRQAEFGGDRLKNWKVDSHSRVLCMDYRDIPRQRYNKISSVEMIEHVGVKNLPKFFNEVYDLLEDDGLFFLQWTGLRRGFKPSRTTIPTEDLVWGLFMNKFIFPGADASLPLAGMLDYMEKAGFEIHSVENVSPHYCITLRKWRDNWVRNKDKVLAAYGDKWFRLWDFFLLWSAYIGDRGSAACFQVVANKNQMKFDRNTFVGGMSLGERPLRRVA
jgi:cyclopropane fatty-acyl-phospholipid synthase-like methyltransferase